MDLLRILLAGLLAAAPMGGCLSDAPLEPRTLGPAATEPPTAPPTAPRDVADADPRPDEPAPPPGPLGEIIVLVPTHEVNDGSAKLTVRHDGKRVFRDSFDLPYEGELTFSVPRRGTSPYTFTLEAEGGRVPSTGAVSFTREGTYTLEPEACPHQEVIVVVLPVDTRDQWGAWETSDDCGTYGAPEPGSPSRADAAGEEGAHQDDAPPRDGADGAEASGSTGPEPGAAHGPTPDARQLRLRFETRQLDGATIVVDVMADGAVLFEDAFDLPDDGVEERTLVLGAAAELVVHYNMSSGHDPNTGASSWTEDSSTTFGMAHCPEQALVTITLPLEPTQRSPYYYLPPKMASSDCGRA